MLAMTTLAEWATAGPWPGSSSMYVDCASDTLPGWEAIARGNARTMWMERLAGQQRPPRGSTPGAYTVGDTVYVSKAHTDKILAISVLRRGSCRRCLRLALRSGRPH